MSDLDYCLYDDGTHATPKRGHDLCDACEAQEREAEQEHERWLAQRETEHESYLDSLVGGTY